jgi:cathepsin L
MRVIATLAVAAMLIACASARAPKAHELTPAYSFQQYLKDQGKSYRVGSAEYMARKSNFERALADVLRHNADTTQSWKKGINRYSDWHETEMKNIRGSRRQKNFKPNPKNEKTFVSENLMAPASSLDYRTAQPPILTAVKDQGMCGDCWAHAVTEAIESAYAKATGNLLVLSQQQITSCTPAESSCWSCDGHYPRYAYEYASNAQYIMEEWVYPFTSYNGSNPSCTNQTNPPYPLKTTVSLAGYTQVAPNRQSDVLNALNNLGPLSILVDAQAWIPYESGIFNGCAYNTSFGLDHAVLFVGYGHDTVTGLDYWIVRNSWSASWGEHGYIRVEKPAVAPCGFDENGLSCFADTPQPAPSCGMCGVITDAQFPIIMQ